MVFRNAGTVSLYIFINLTNIAEGQNAALPEFGGRSATRIPVENLWYFMILQEAGHMRKAPPPPHKPAHPTNPQ